MIRRALFSLLTLAVATFVVFSLSRGLSDPRYIMLPDVGYGINQEKWEALGEQLHLNDPVPVQFGYWIWDLTRGDLGNDLTDDRPIGPKIVKKLAATVRLAVPAWILATVIGVPMGVLAAVKRGTVLDNALRGFALIGQAVPVFFAALLAILIVAVWLEWLPPATMGEGKAYRNYVMPVVILAWLPAAGYLRLTRSAMLEVLDSEYVKLARGKGVPRWQVTWKHVFRNAALIPLTATGLVLAGFITGSVLLETVFAWPGIGQFTVQAVTGNNINVLVVIIMIFTALFIVTNFLVDMLYGVIDPRIRYS